MSKTQNLPGPARQRASSTNQDSQAQHTLNMAHVTWGLSLSRGGVQGAWKRQDSGSHGEPTWSQHHLILKHRGADWG